MNKKTATLPGKKFFNEKMAAWILRLLLAADILFIALHTIRFFKPPFPGKFYSLGRETGYPEMYQNVKWLLIVILLIHVSKIRRSLSYPVWGLVFAYLFLDDTFQIHEKVGKYLADNFNFSPAFGLRPQDFGELAVSAVAVMILSPLVTWVYMNGDQAFKKVSRDLLMLILALVFFGIGVDLVHSAMAQIREVNFILLTIEEGGEMFVASLILCYVFLLSAGGEYTGSNFRHYLRTVFTKR